MKILITSDLNPETINGVVTSILTLMQGLEASGHDVKLLTLNTIHKDEKTADGRIYRVGSFPADRIYPNVRVTERIISPLLMEIIGWKPDIIHTNCEFATFTMARIIGHYSEAPIVHTYHTLYEDYAAYVVRSEAIGRVASREISRFIAAQVDHLIVPSNKIYDLLHDNYGIQTPIRVIPTGIETGRFGSTPAEYLPAIEKIRKKLNGRKAVLYLGRVAKEKNIDVLIEISDRFGDDAVLLIVGGGPYLESLKELAKKKKKDNIIFTGMISPEAVPAYYTLGTIFSSASTSETQGLTYYEALASGLPLVCIQDVCLKDILQNGKTGYACADAEDLLQKINDMLSLSPAESADYRINALAMAGKYDTAHFVSEVLGLYTQVVRQGCSHKKISIRHILHRNILM